MSTITVNSIPSYLQPDGTNVIDNGNGTYDILDLSKNDKISLSQILGSKRNSFTYMDVTVSGNQLSNPSVSFTNEDVGRYLAIKKGHHNPNTADGSEIPNTTLGRIVTATVKITAVDTVNDTATISKSLNKTGALRAYKYTNNSDEIQQAINLGYYFDIETVVFDIKGVIAMNSYHADYYTGFTGLNIQSSLDKNIRLVDGGEVKFLKNAIEDSDTTHQVFLVDQGNGDLYSDFNILPGDNAATPFFKGCDLLDFGIDNYSVMVRSLTVKNVILRDEDFDGTAGSFRANVTGSGGGNSESELDKREYQVIHMENMDTRNFGTGYGAFNNPASVDLTGGTTDIRMINANIERWSSDNILMRGREQIYAFDRNASESFPGSYRFTPSYEYNLYIDPSYSGSFTALDGKVTVNEALLPSLNFVELSLEDRVNRGFKVAIQHEAGGTRYYLDNTKPVTKNTATFTGIPNGTYSYIEITNESDVDNSITAPQVQMG